jgi:hypothetical protein
MQTNDLNMSENYSSGLLGFKPLQETTRRSDELVQQSSSATTLLSPANAFIGTEPSSILLTRSDLFVSGAGLYGKPKRSKTTSRHFQQHLFADINVQSSFDIAFDKYLKYKACPSPNGETKAKRNLRTTAATYLRLKKSALLNAIHSHRQNQTISENQPALDALTTLFKLIETTTLNNVGDRSEEFRRLTKSYNRQIQELFDHTKETQFDCVEAQEIIINPRPRRNLLAHGFSAPQTIGPIQQIWKEYRDWIIPETPPNLAIIMEDWEHRIFNSQRTFEYYAYDVCGRTDPSGLPASRRYALPESRREITRRVIGLLNIRWDSFANVILRG